MKNSNIASGATSWKIFMISVQKTISLMLESLGKHIEAGREMSLQIVLEQFNEAEDAVDKIEEEMIECQRALKRVQEKLEYNKGSYEKALEEVAKYEALKNQKKVLHQEMEQKEDEQKKADRRAAKLSAHYTKYESKIKRKTGVILQKLLEKMEEIQAEAIEEQQGTLHFKFKVKDGKETWYKIVKPEWGAMTLYRFEANGDREKIAAGINMLQAFKKENEEETKRVAEAAIAQMRVLQNRAQKGKEKISV